MGLGPQPEPPVAGQFELCGEELDQQTPVQNSSFSFQKDRSPSIVGALGELPEGREVRCGFIWIFVLPRFFGISKLRAKRVCSCGKLDRIGSRLLQELHPQGMVTPLSVCRGVL